MCVSLHREVFLCSGDRLTASVGPESCRPKHPLFREQPLISLFLPPLLSYSLFLSTSVPSLSPSLTPAPPLPHLLPSVTLCPPLSAIPPSLTHSLPASSPLSLPSYVSQQLDHQAKKSLYTELKVLFFPLPSSVPLWRVGVARKLIRLRRAR